MASGKLPQTASSEVAAGRITLVPDNVGIGAVSPLIVSVASLLPATMLAGTPTYVGHPASSSLDFPLSIAMKSDRSVIPLPSLIIIAKTRYTKLKGVIIFMTTWQDALLLAASNVLTRFFSFLPSLFGALVIFFVGLVLAKWTKALIVKILSAIKLDVLVKKSGIGSYLNKAEIRMRAEVFFGEIVRWLIIIVFFIASVNVLGLTTVSTVLNSLLSYLPRIISAILILTAGVFLAGLVESLIKGAVSQIDVKTSRLLSKIGSYLVVIVTALAAINELGIAQSLINILFIGVITTLSLGLGLAIGLGAKDLVSQLLNDWYSQGKKKKK